MKLSILRLGTTINLESSIVSTLQIENRFVFTRVTASLQSEKGEEAVEPYQLTDESNKPISPKKALFLLNTLPALPLNDRSLLTNLYKNICTQSNESSNTDCSSEYLNELMQKVFSETSNLTHSTWGNYDFGLEWNLETLLKAFCFTPLVEDESSLLENSIAFFELLADINFSAPIIFVNAKSFFASHDLEILFEQAIFCGIKLLLLESWNDENNYKNERKTIVDQHLLIS